MKGLLIKDFCLLKGQKRFFLVVVAAAIIMATTTADASFILGYLTVVLSLFSLNTISYDEFDNGNAFLFTLPFSRRTYVLEKYCFALLLGVIALLVASVLALVVGTVTITELLIGGLSIFAAMLLLQSVMLPLQFKFGAEKSRILLIAIVCVVFALGFSLPKVVDMDAVLAEMEALSPAVVVGSLLAAAVVVLLISVKVSLSVMEKKEF